MKTVIILFGAPRCGKGYFGDSLIESLVRKKFYSREDILKVSTVRCFIPKGTIFAI